MGNTSSQRCSQNGALNARVVSFAKTDNAVERKITMHDSRFVSVTTHPLVVAGWHAAHSNTVLIHKSSTIHNAPNFLVRFNTTMACLSILGTRSTTDKNNWLSGLNIAEVSLNILRSSVVNCASSRTRAFSKLHGCEIGECGTTVILVPD